VHYCKLLSFRTGSVLLRRLGIGFKVMVSDRFVVYDVHTAGHEHSKGLTKIWCSYIHTTH